MIPSHPAGQTYRESKEHKPLSCLCKTVRVRRRPCFANANVTSKSGSDVYTSIYLGIHVLLSVYLKFRLGDRLAIHHISGAGAGRLKRGKVRIGQHRVMAGLLLLL